MGSDPQFHNIWMCKALLRIPANSWGAFGPVVTPVFQFLLILYAPATLPHHDSSSVKTVPVHSLHLRAHTAHNVCGCRCTKVLSLGEAGEDVITQGRKVKRNTSHPWNTYNREISALCYPIFSSHLIPSDWLFFSFSILISSLHLPPWSNGEVSEKEVWVLLRISIAISHPIPHRLLYVQVLETSPFALLFRSRS